MLSRYAASMVKDLAATDMINDLMGIAFRHRLQLPSEVVMLFRLIILSEGLGLTLDPNFQLFAFAAPHFERFWAKRRSPDVLATQMAQGAIDASEVTLQLPRQMARILGHLERGTLQVNIGPDSTREIMQQMQRMVNRVALSVILAGTIMGLGLVMVAYRPAGWERFGGAITTIAFVGSLLVGFVLLWSIFRTGGD
jgi:ubiquinone biosynthesis protein